MVKTKGSKDLKPRKQRVDKGKPRETYRGKKVKYPQREIRSNFKKYYAEDINFRNQYKAICRKGQRKYYNKNSKEINKKRAMIIKASPERTIKEKIRTHFRTAITNYKLTGRTPLSNKYKIDYKRIIEHLKPFPKEVSKYHIDHIRPLCSFKFLNKDGTLNLEEIKRAYAPENHQWLTIQENLCKNGSLNYG